MDQDSLQCDTKCRKAGSISDLHLDYSVCPFQHFCNCICPDVSTCENDCAQQGKIPVFGVNNKANCDICECQCQRVNCTEECMGHAFEERSNRFNCTECKCICTDCDLSCNGTGLGIKGAVDKSGCAPCIGCRIPEDQSKFMVVMGSRSNN